MTSTSKWKRIKRHHGEDGSSNSQTDRIVEFEKLVASSEKFGRLCHEYFNNKGKKNEQDVDNVEKLEVIDRFIKHCNLDGDPLKHWLGYMDLWKNDGFETGIYSESLFMILKRCSMALFHHPKYSCDPSFIRILVIYAEQEKDKTEILFWYYYKQHIGVTKLAIFFISFAFVMEKKFDYKLADCIYKKALEVDAKPREVIVKRYQGFQHRVRYYDIDLQEGSDFEYYCDEAREDSMNFFRLFGDRNTLTKERDKAHSTFEIYSDPAANSKLVFKQVPEEKRKSSKNFYKSDNIDSFHQKIERIKPTYVFEKYIEMDGKEVCFEEVRAARKYYRLFIPEKSTKSRKGRGYIEYGTLHKKNCDEALNRMMQRALLDKTVLNRPRSTLPKSLFRFSKREIMIKVGGQEILVKNELGRGSYGIVLLVALCTSSSSLQENVALKIQKDCKSLAWEYEILEKLQNRIRNTNESSSSHNIMFPSPLSFTLLSDGATMGMTAANTTGLNLVDLVNAYNRSVPEILAIHYTSRMLRIIEALHLEGKTLHCDIKPDNFVLTTSSYILPNTALKVSASDIMLIDFGRAVEVVDIVNGGLYGNVAAKDLECVAMRSSQIWNYDIDTFGICVSAYMLLYGSYIEIEQDQATGTWRLKKPLKRYWQVYLWDKLFRFFLNMKSPMNLDDYAKNVKQIRYAFEDHLKDNKQRCDLVSMLSRQEKILSRRM